MTKRAIALAAALIAFGIMLPALATTKNVSLKNVAYNPSTITVKVGDKVVWTNNDNLPHSVTAADNSFDSSPSCSPNATTGCMMQGATFPHTFGKAGTFVYYCRVHCPNNGCAQGGMRGQVIVQAASTPAPTHTTAPTTTPRHTTTPTKTAAPAPRTTSKPSASPTPRPKGSPTATPSNGPTSGVSPIGSPSSSAIAFGAPKNTSRGLLIGIAIGAVAVAAGAGLLFWFRTRGAA